MGYTHGNEVQIINSKTDSVMLFTVEKRDALREAYDKAVKENAFQFVFEDHQLLTKYAKYLLEYLDMRFEQGDTHVSPI